MFGLAFIISGMTDSQGLNVGEKANDFTLANVDGKLISLGSYKNAKGYIVIFTCNNCLYAKAYQKRIAELQDKYAIKGFPVIAINTSDSKEDIKARAKDQKYPFLYLNDETKEVTKTYGATNTPQVYVLKKDKTVAYIGAIDNKYKDSNTADKQYVQDAVEALLANEEVTTNHTKAIGCSIKLKTN